MLPSIPRLADYDLSPAHGFLPAAPPLAALPDPYYAPWEAVARALPALVLARRLRGVVDALPRLSTRRLRSEPEWRRAYSVLAFLAHAYVWGGDRPADVVPPPVAAPFLEACRHLQLPPVATYAGVCLWNFKPLFEDEPVDGLDNLATLQTFTGSTDESWFYLVSVAIEARGAPVVPTMLAAFEAARRGDVATVTAALQTFAETVDEIGSLLTRMYDSCDPHVFYHRIRPFLAGSKNMGEAGLPHGVKFDDGTGTAEYVQLGGGSNAQSSLIQFFDLALGVEHLPTGQSRQSSASDSEGQGPPPPSHNFIKDMRRYMPGPHRRFLERVAVVANIREFVDAHRADRGLCASYDACLAMLRALRDKHIQIVSRYIIVKSREALPHARSLSPRSAPAPPQKLNLASARLSTADRAANASKKLRGTGGTALIPFLKQARDETGEPAIGTWARRLLTNSPGIGIAPLGGVEEHQDGKMDIVGLAGIWSVDDSEGGICHW